MRVFAKFDQNKICTGHIVSTDPNFKMPSIYEEVLNEREKKLVLSGKCKKTINDRGQRIIVLC